MGSPQKIIPEMCDRHRRIQTVPQVDFLVGRVVPIDTVVPVIEARDNRIDILDLSYVGYRFAGSDARADLNDDGIVDILDLSMVGTNFGRIGPELWQR